MKLTKEEIYAMLQGQPAKQPARDINQRQSSRQGMKHKPQNTVSFEVSINMYVYRKKCISR